MRTALLTGAAAAALALTATAAARAETVYVADMDTVVAPAPGYVYADDPDYVVQDRTYVRERPYVVVAPPRERVRRRCRGARSSHHRVRSSSIGRPTRRRARAIARSAQTTTPPPPATAVPA